MPTNLIIIFSKTKFFMKKLDCLGISSYYEGLPRGEKDGFYAYALLRANRGKPRKDLRDWMELRHTKKEFRFLMQFFLSFPFPFSK